MKKLITLISIVAFALTSCEKDETIEPKDYTTYSATINMNSEDGKEIPELGPPPEYTPTGNMVVQYFYSAQYTFNIDDKNSLIGVVNSDVQNYQNVVVPVAPTSTLEENLPSIKNWQLMFTLYETDAFYESTSTWYPLSLVGVLINSEEGVEVSNVKDEMFDTITLDQAQSKEYKNNIDAIGHDWQFYDRENRRYQIITNNYYLVKLSEDEIYKLRFMDFYGDGKDIDEKGHITFQYELLK